VTAEGAADGPGAASPEYNDASDGSIAPLDGSIAQTADGELAEVEPPEDANEGDSSYGIWSDAAIPVSCSFAPANEIDVDAGFPTPLGSGSDGGSGFGPCSQGGWCAPSGAIPNTLLMGVWGTGPDDVWAIGDNGGTPLHWSGSGWSGVTGAGSGDYPRVGTENAIWGSGPQDIWVVGEAGAAHWDGAQWAPAPLGEIFLSGVWGSGPDDVWAVGAGMRGHPTVFHWDGAEWSVAIQPSAELFAVWGSGPKDVWVTGVDSVFHWDGGAWSTAMMCDENHLNGIWGSSADDVWIVGDHVAHHWDGTTWSTAASAAIFNAVWGSASNDVWAVGEGGAIAHWDGSLWTAVASGVSTSLKNVWGSGPKDVWIVGDAGVILHH
jgi:hypothetical protein